MRRTATHGWWLIVDVVRSAHVIQQGPIMCLVWVLHVTMLHITPQGVKRLDMVMWRVGMSAPVHVRHTPTLPCHACCLLLVHPIAIRAAYQAGSEPCRLSSRNC